jgi:hypothetical protein
MRRLADNKRQRLIRMKIERIEKARSLYQRRQGKRLNFRMKSII